MSTDPHLHNAASEPEPDAANANAPLTQEQVMQAATARTLTFADMAVQSVEAFAVATWADDMGQCPVPLCTQAELAAEAVRDAQSTRLFADLAAVVTEEERV